MSALRKHFAISSQDFARWLDSQPGTWWLVDGDPELTSRIGFPCPNDELADELRRIDRDLVVYTNRPVGLEDGQQLDSQGLSQLADIDNRRHERNFLVRWEDSDIEWLLSEDKSAAEAFSNVAMER